MNINLQTLGTFNQLVHDGAEQAAADLQQLAGITPSVEATRTDLSTYADVVEELSSEEFVAVTIRFENGLSGRAILVFERSAAETLTDHLQGRDAANESAVSEGIQEVGNILLSGFIDGWADHLGRPIDISPPTVTAGSGESLLETVEGEYDSDSPLLSFTSSLRTAADDITGTVFLFPERESLKQLLSERDVNDAAPISLKNLQMFKAMTQVGTERASENVTMMTGTETSVDVSRVSFLPIEQTVSLIDDRPYVGVVTGLNGVPSGYLLILFDEQSACRLVEQLGAGVYESEFEPAHRSAIEELGNIMTSGFIDGWANVLGTSITHTPPEFIHDFAPAIMDRLAAELAVDQEYVFLFDSSIETTDNAISCEIFALPNEAELRAALEELDPKTMDLDEESSLAAAMEADPDEFL